MRLVWLAPPTIAALPFQARNRHVLEHLIRYMDEQGLLARPVKIEDIFAPNVIGEFKV